MSISFLTESSLYSKIFTMLLGFAACLISSWFLVFLSRVLSLGNDKSNGVQKFHVNTTSRLGGVAIFIGLAVIVALAPSVHLLLGNENYLSSEFRHFSFWFLLTATPVWLAGLAEDLTHRVGPTLRLVMATMAAAWLFGVLSFSVTRTDVWPIDILLMIPGAPLCVTLLVVAGFTHSVNIIDGFHGLACGLVVIALTALAYMSWIVDDTLIFQMSLFSLSVVLGFFALNWPKGIIFLGDAGAYLIGFWLVELGILLAARNPEISPMAPVVAALLPLIETLFSMYRRKVVRNHPVNHPDALHLHTLVYRRLVYNPALDYTTQKKNVSNSKVAIFFWAPAACFASLACILMRSTQAQILLMLMYLVMYVWLYKRLVCFNSPKFMRLR